MNQLKTPVFLEDGARLTSEPRVSIIPAPLAKTVSWVGGTDKGPEAVLVASEILELFDDELLVDTWRVGIDTMPMPDYSSASALEACEDIFVLVDTCLEQGRLPVVIGGEHTVSVPAIAASLRHYPDLTVLQIDAHLDLRDSYEGDELSHACVMRRLDDLAIPFVQVAIRSFCRDEYELVKARGWQPVYMKDIQGDGDWLETICNKLKGPVYITFDCDAFDPAIMPATGTPEPNGLGWGQVTQLFKRLAASHKIVGLDFVEFAPIAGGHHAAYTMAKLIYRTLGYIFHKELQRAEQMIVTEYEDIFKCRQCGHCCQGETTVSLDEEDVERMVKYIGLPFEQVKEKYLRVTGNVIQMKIVDGHCIFYRDGCTVHQGKPWRCGQWPLHPSILADKANLEAIRDSCPGLAKNMDYEEFCKKLKVLLDEKK